MNSAMEVETVLDNAAANGAADLESDVVVFHTPSAGRSKKGLMLVLLIAILAAIAVGIAVGTDNDVTADPPATRTTAIQEATPVEQDQVPKEVVVDAPKPAPPKKEDVTTMTPTYTSSHGGTVTVSTETSSPPTVPDRDDRRSLMIKSPTWRG